MTTAAEVLIAFGVGFAFVTLYYLCNAGLAIVAQTVFCYDNPTGAVYKIADFPMALPGLVFRLITSPQTRSAYFPGKEGHLRLEAFFFLDNVILYSAAAYFVFLF